MARAQSVTLVLSREQVAVSPRAALSLLDVLGFDVGFVMVATVRETRCQKPEAGTPIPN